MKSKIIFTALVFYKTLLDPSYTWSLEKSVRIHGAGISGLMSALCLVKEGYTVYLHDKRAKDELFKRGQYYINLKENAVEFFKNWNILEEFENYPGIDTIKEHIISGHPGNHQRSKYSTSIATIQKFLYDQLEKKEYSNKFIHKKTFTKFEYIKLDETVDFQIWAGGARSLPNDITKILHTKNKQDEIWQFTVTDFNILDNKLYTYIYTDREKDENYIYHLGDRKTSIAKRITIDQYDRKNKLQVKIINSYASKFYDKDKKILFIGDSIVASTPRMGMGATLSLTKYPRAVMQFAKNLDIKTEDKNYNDFSSIILECINDWLIQGNRIFNLGLNEDEIIYSN